ncbi:MAG: hypothetical protein LKG27_04745 [Clostridiaceae bacterium]|jgi:hypothetical protein|nr:hypothetical protein [Clostridiaceae bacterium]
MRKDIEKFLNSKSFTPMWCEEDIEQVALNRAYTDQRKSLMTLMSELEDIKNTIEDAKLREWNLGNLLKFHDAGIAKE